MKELKDYLPFYLGAKVRYSYYDYNEDTWTVWETLTPHVLDKITTDWSIKSIQIQLRLLSDMTVEEAHECGNLDYDFSDEPDLNKWDWKVFEAVNSPNQFKYLLFKHFDIFGLIEAGLAIDKTTLKSTTI